MVWLKKNFFFFIRQPWRSAALTRKTNPTCIFVVLTCSGHIWIIPVQPRELLCYHMEQFTKRLEVEWREFTPQTNTAQLSLRLEDNVGCWGFVLFCFCCCFFSIGTLCAFGGTSNSFELSKEHWPHCHHLSQMNRSCVPVGWGQCSLSGVTFPARPDVGLECPRPQIQNFSYFCHLCSLLWIDFEIITSDLGGDDDSFQNFRSDMMRGVGVSGQHKGPRSEEGTMQGDSGI